MTVPPAVRERFWSRVAVGGAAECWLWNGAVNGGGYGGSSISGKPNGAHRIAWILTHGPIPDGLHVCHTCDTPRCCNVNHLFLGTQAENMADSARKGRTRKTPPERIYALIRAMQHKVGRAEIPTAGLPRMVRQLETLTKGNRLLKPKKFHRLARELAAFSAKLENFAYRVRARAEAMEARRLT